jgi:hypothetical protein
MSSFMTPRQTKAAGSGEAPVASAPLLGSAATRLQRDSKGSQKGGDSVQPSLNPNPPYKAWNTDV